MYAFPPRFTGLISFIVFSLLFTFSIRESTAQIMMSPEAGSFGLYGGIVQSSLGKQPLAENAGLSHQYFSGYEVGIKKELYRGDWFKGNLYIGYLQFGSEEFNLESTVSQNTTVDLKAVKVAVTPLLLKAGSDFIHGYAGGGAFGSMIIEQSIEGYEGSNDYWTTGEELEKIDYGLHLQAGVHVWNFELEFNAQFGQQELGLRRDESKAESTFYSLTLSYMFINRNITRKSCKDTRFN
jgi:hypothetical protein